MDSKVPRTHVVTPTNATSRKFLGKTENFKNNQERHFYQRMLKAYTKGKQYFFFGFDIDGKPIRHRVEQLYS